MNIIWNRMFQLFVSTFLYTLITFTQKWETFTGGIIFCMNFVFRTQGGGKKQLLRTKK